MERRQFNPEEKEFLRKNFPRFSRKDINPLLARKRCKISYRTDNPFNSYPDGAVMESDKSILLWINLTKALEQQHISIVHEMLHVFYNREGFGKGLFDYLELKYKERMSPLLGDVYWNEYEDFVDEESESVYRHNPIIIPEIRRHFTEEVHVPGWTRLYVTETEEFREVSKMPSKDAKVEIVYYRKY